MGTSQSNPGPSGATPLVPPWADDQPGQPLPVPDDRRFMGFRQSLGQFVVAGNSDNLKSAIGHYARKSTGGSAAATRRFGTVTQVGADLFGALTSQGIAGTITSTKIDFASMAGQPCDVAVATIAQALTPENGDADKVRAAMNTALTEALDGLDVFDPSAITDEVIVNTMIAYLAESIFLQIVMDAGQAWNKAETAIQTLNAEADLRELVKVVVDKHMAQEFPNRIRSFTRNDIIQIERRTITAVWQEWETYQ